MKTNVAQSTSAHASASIRNICEASRTTRRRDARSAE
jgi:hypothetical protein